MRVSSRGRRERRRSPLLMDAGRRADGRTGWLRSAEEKGEEQEKGEQKEEAESKRKKKRWNSVVYPVIYNWKLGTTARPKAICRFHPGESPPFSARAVCRRSFDLRPESMLALVIRFSVCLASFFPFRAAVCSHRATGRTRRRFPAFGLPSFLWFIYAKSWKLAF